MAFSVNGSQENDSQCEWRSMKMTVNVNDSQGESQSGKCQSREWQVMWMTVKLNDS